MGMGHISNYADTVEDKFVKEVCPKEHKELMDLIEHLDINFDMFAYGLDFYSGMDDIEEVTDEDESNLRCLYSNLQTAFNKATGLSIEVRFHDQSEFGSRYDMVDAGFWGVEGVYQMTPAAKKIKDKIERKFWVTYG